MKHRIFLLLWRLLGEFTASQWQKHDGKWVRLVFSKSKTGYRFYIDDGKSGDKVWGRSLVASVEPTDFGVQPPRPWPRTLPEPSSYPPMPKVPAPKPDADSIDPKIAAAITRATEKVKGEIINLIRGGAFS